MTNTETSASTRTACRNCGRAMYVQAVGFDRHEHNDSQWCTSPGGTKAEAAN